MKKFMSFFLILALIFTTIVPVFAADPIKAKVELKKAIEIAKEKLNINTEGYNFNSSYSEDQEGRKNWYLNWEAKKGKTGSINTSVDAETGDIINFNTYSPSDSFSKIPKYSREQALKAASDFAMKLQPGKFTETRILDQDELMNKINPYYADTYTFNFTRIVNGIPYIDNKININVEKNTLKIRDYYFLWDDKVFPDVKKAISIEEAKKLFKEKLGVEVSYN
jgi:hypothetical protein